MSLMIGRDDDDNDYDDDDDDESPTFYSRT